MSATTDQDHSFNHPDDGPKTDPGEPGGVSAETRIQYETLFGRMVRQCQERGWNGEIEYTHIVTYKELVDDLLKNPRQLKYSTLFRMRSALLYCMKGEVGESLKQYMRTSEFLEKLAEAGRDGNKNSRSKGRHIPENDYRLILETLSKSRGMAAEVLVFLKATVATGARPIEWTTAIWENRRQGILRLETAKAKTRNPLNKNSSSIVSSFKEGREIIETRLIQVDQSEIEVVDQHILNVCKVLNMAETGYFWDNMPRDLRAQCFQPYFNKCRIALYRASEKSTGTHYSFYDARSTFAANRRARDGIEASAKALGHSSEKINTNTSSHYANRYKAWSAYKMSQTPGQAMAENQKDSFAQIPVTFNIPDFSTRGS